MGVGFWCDVGYWSSADKDFITNLSEVTFLDFHRPFIIPVLKGTPPVEIDNDDYPDTYGTNDLTEWYNFVDTYYGPDWYITYGCFNTLGHDTFTSGESLFKEFLPGWDVGWPKTNEYMKSLSKDEQENTSFAIYIASLKRVILSNGIYKVEDGGTVSKLDGFPYYTFMYNVTLRDWTFNKDGDRNGGSIDGIIVASPDYKTYNDLKDGNIVRRVIMSADQTAWQHEHRYYERGMRTGYTSKAMVLLFTDGTAPDFEGYDIPPENPYEPGGDSGPGINPPGTFDDTSDPIPDSPLPTLSAANTGFTRIYNPTLAQVQNLAQYLWTDETVIQTIWNHIKQFFENPMEAIIGFNLVPVPVPDAGSKNFALMYIDTGVSMNVAANQFVDLDCGTVKLERYYGSAMDQSPYTKVSCFLPYIGMVTLNTDEVMGTTLQVLYRVDIVSGSCVAKILVDGNVLYQYSGHCAINIPISAADFSSYVSAAISVAKLAVGAIAGGVSGALAAAGSDASQATNNIVTHTTTETTTARNPATGRQITSGTRTTLETFEWPVDSDSTRASYAGLTAENVTNTAAQVIASKPHVMHSGSFSGNTGYLGVRRPYLIIERPNMCLPKDYQSFNGFPSMITMTLNECKGFTKVQQVQLTGMTATNPEQAEILMLLKSGVIF